MYGMLTIIGITIIEWHNGYRKRRAQKEKIKEELLPVAWHPIRVMNCMSGDEKRWWEQQIVVGIR